MTPNDQKPEIFDHEIEYQSGNGDISWESFECVKYTDYLAVCAERDKRGEELLKCNIAYGDAKERAENAEVEIAKLKAHNWVLKDNSLRTYDGLSEKADRVDELEEKLERAAATIIDLRLFIGEEKWKILFGEPTNGLEGN